MEGTWQLSSRNKVIPGMGGLDVGGPGMSGRHGFNFFLTFTVLFSFFMAVPAQAQRAEPVMPIVINGNTVTLTYENENTLTLEYLGSEAILGVGEGEEVNGEYIAKKSGAYTCLHRPGHPEVSHTDVKVSGNQLIFTYLDRVGCNEENITFEMFNGDPYVKMNGVVVAHLGQDGSRLTLDNQTPCASTTAASTPQPAMATATAMVTAMATATAMAMATATAMVTGMATGMGMATAPRRVVSSGVGWSAIWIAPSQTRSRAALVWSAAGCVTPRRSRSLWTICPHKGSATAPSGWTRSKCVGTQTTALGCCSTGIF